MYIIREALGEEHDRLNGLFEEFRTLRTRDPATARIRLERFRGLLLLRMGLEDRILFPFYEARVPPPQRVAVNAMREEHRQIRELLTLLDRRLGGGEDPAGLEQELVEMLDVHMSVEEVLFIPWVEALEAGEREALLERMRAFRINFRAGPDGSGT